jgi:uracil-DNA glycosylase family protein
MSSNGITIAELRAEARGCHACDLWKIGTQTVFGEGREKAKVMFVGEQPGDQEDLAGRPFVGSAGKLLDRALEEAGIDRSLVYVTNVVKHFKWKQRGKRRIHEKPGAKEINACIPWLDGEIAVIDPEIIVCLGATAAQALLGSDFQVTKERGQWIDTTGVTKIIATVHPSSILRTPEDLRGIEYADFVDDLRIVSKRMAAS